MEDDRSLQAGVLTLRHWYAYVLLLGILLRGHPNR